MSQDAYLGTRSLFRLACLEACRDGTLDADEQAFLKRLQQRLRIPPEFSRQVLKQAKVDCAADPAPDSRPLDPASLFSLACELAWSKGQLEDREALLLDVLGEMLELDPKVQGLLRDAHAPRPVPLGLRAAALVVLPSAPPAAPPGPADGAGRGPGAVPPEAPDSLVPAPDLASVRPDPGATPPEADAADPAPRPPALAPRTPAPPRPRLALPAAPPEELPARTVGGVLGWLARTVGLDRAATQRVERANRFLAVLRRALLRLEQVDPPRAQLVQLSRHMTEMGDLQAPREAGRFQPHAGVTANLQNDALLEMVEGLAEAGDAAAPGEHLMQWMMASWFALDALHVERRVMASLLPQYDYLAELVEAARRARPDLLPPHLVRIVVAIGLELEAAGHAELGQRLGQGLSLGLERALPSQPLRIHEGDYRSLDLGKVGRQVAADLRNLDARPRLHLLPVPSFPMLTAALQLGFGSLRYDGASHPETRAFFWVTHDHARALGQALGRRLQAFVLELTCFEEGAASTLADALAPTSQVDALRVHHRSGDEVTVSEAEALARVVTRMRAQMFQLWAGDFDPGALDALAAGLRAAGNQTLVQVEVCDLDRPEDDPGHWVTVPALEALTEENRARST